MIYKTAVDSGASTSAITRNATSEDSSEIHNSMNNNTQVVNEQPQEVNELDAVFWPISPDQSTVPETPPQPKQPEPLQHDVTLAPYKKTHTL